MKTVFNSKLVATGQAFKRALYMSRRKTVLWFLGIIALVATPTAALLWPSGTMASSSALPNQASNSINTSNSGNDDAQKPATPVLNQTSNDDSNESAGTTQNSNSTTVTVNGETIQTPANSSTDQIITNDGQTTHVTVQNNSSSSGNNNHSSTHVNVHSTSNSHSHLS